MLKRFLFIVILSFMLIPVFAQTGIGTTTPHASAKLEVASSTQGFLPPRIALTATNSASPISSPANGLMVFNTASAGASPFNVVPGYYYWDVTGQQWVSLSTTVGNVQNQAIFRSSSNTSAGQAITSWNSRFNNIASGDLTVNSSTTFTLSNGLYKIEWALPTSLQILITPCNYKNCLLEIGCRLEVMVVMLIYQMEVIPIGEVVHLLQIFWIVLLDPKRYELLIMMEPQEPYFMV
jgi:hypothetical protein